MIVVAPPDASAGDATAIRTSARDFPLAVRIGSSSPASKKPSPAIAAPSKLPFVNVMPPASSGSIASRSLADPGPLLPPLASVAAGCSVGSAEVSAGADVGGDVDSDGAAGVAVAAVPPQAATPRTMLRTPASRRRSWVMSLYPLAGYGARIVAMPRPSGYPLVG